jgi:hypothetical protein
MVTRTAQVAAGREADSRRKPFRADAGLADERASRIDRLRMTPRVSEGSAGGRIGERVRRPRPARRPP